MNRNVVFLVGLAAIIVLVSLLPADVFAATRALLVVAAAALLLLLALGVLLRPARALLGKLFTSTVAPGPVFAVADEREWRDLLKPLLGALVCVAVAGIASLVRTLRA